LTRGPGIADHGGHSQRKGPASEATPRGRTDARTSMDPSLPNGTPKKKLWGPCEACGRDVIAASTVQGTTLTVEYCREGKGNLALTGSLFDASIVVVPTERTHFRKHRCPTALPSFSAASFARKARPESPIRNTPTSAKGRK
jgi:hypothetical protein